jgi:ABC-type bacteriocin/lantibiotic exporter with double-glycine peptidase domain
VNSFYCYLREGISRKPTIDRLSDGNIDSRAKINLKNLNLLLRRHWRKVFLSGLLIFLTSLLSFPQPLILRFLIDGVILSRQLDLLAGAIILLAGISFAQTITTSVQEFYLSRFEQEILLDIRHELLERALRFPKSFFDDTETGYLMSRLSDDIQGLQWFFSGTIVHIISNVLRLSGGVMLLLCLEWRLAACALVILPGVALCVWYFSNKIHALSHHGMEKEARVASRLQESLASVSLMKAFAAETRTVGRMMSELKGALQIAMERIAVNSIATLSINSIPGIARAIVLATGAYLIIKEQWSLGSLLAFQAYLGYVFGPAQYLAAANLQLQNALASLERTSILLDIVPEDQTGAGITVGRLAGEVMFKDVSFYYDHRNPILKGLFFTIPPGRHTAIVGPSGVGKTTLVSLILRFYKPTAGEIYFDGRPASSYNLRALRERIGYVSQSTLLLSGTILENLTYGNPDAGKREVVRATRAAGIHEFIETLPEGYNTEIGEKGVKLSEGQKQRLSIARALIKDPDILVLDEPSSALDKLTENTIFDTIPAVLKDKTLFVVTNRLSTVRAADPIILLDENRLLTTGTYQSLLESNEYFRRLVSGEHCTPPADPPPGDENS